MSGEIPSRTIEKQIIQAGDPQDPVKLCWEALLPFVPKMLFVLPYENLFKSLMRKDAALAGDSDCPIWFEFKSLQAQQWCDFVVVVVVWELWGFLFDSRE